DFAVFAMSFFDCDKIKLKEDSIIYIKTNDDELENIVGNLNENNISIFMDKVLSSFIENSENPVRNKINSFTYASEYKELLETLYSKPDKNTFIANHQSTSILYRAIKGHEPQKNKYTLGDLSSCYIYQAVKLGMILDYHALNQFVDCHKESGTSTPEFFKLLNTELKNVESFAKIKIAENNILRFYEPIIKNEISTHTYRIANQIVDASNMMYFLLNQTQNFAGYINPEVSEEQEDLPIFYSLFMNTHKNIAPVLDTFLNTLELKVGTPKDKPLLDYITISDNFKNEIYISLSPENRKKLEDDGSTLMDMYEFPYDEKTIKVAQERLAQSYYDLELSDRILGITPTNNQIILIPPEIDFDEDDGSDDFIKVQNFNPPTDKEPRMFR
ncbi:MAG: hypothetical protein WCR54_08835, partial [Clostridia bacterium]